MLAEIFPVFCVGCEKFNEFLCISCAKSVQLNDLQSRTGFEFYSGFAYEGVMATTLSKFKDKHQFGYGRVIAKHFQNSFQIDSGLPVLVPPSTKASFRKRGFDPSYELAKQAGLNVTKRLRRIKQTLDQQNLDFDQRQSNQDNAFQLSEPGKYILFDDVITTGATVREMIRAVEAAGGEVSKVVALCSTSTKGAN